MRVPITEQRLRLEIAVHRALGRLRNERGTALTEYGMLLMTGVMVVIGLLALFGEAVLNLFTDAEDEFNTLPPPPPPD